MPDILPPDAPEVASPEWNFEVPLGGVVWAYRLTWNSRDESWALDLAPQDGSSNLLGKKLTVNYPVWRHTGRLPAGGVIAFLDMEGNGVERPTFEGLGWRWKLVWVEDDDFPAGTTARPWSITVP